MAAHQAPQSLGFSRQEHWSGLPFLSPGDPGIEPVSPSLQVDSLLSEPPGKPIQVRAPSFECQSNRLSSLTSMLLFVHSFYHLSSSEFQPVRILPTSRLSSELSFSTSAPPPAQILRGCDGKPSQFCGTKSVSPWPPYRLCRQYGSYWMGGMLILSVNLTGLRNAQIAGKHYF